MQGESRVVILDRAIILAFGPIGISAIDEGAGIAGIELDGFIQIEDGVIVIALGRERAAATGASRATDPDGD